MILRYFMKFYENIFAHTEADKFSIRSQLFFLYILLDDWKEPFHMLCCISWKTIFACFLI